MNKVNEIKIKTANQKLLFGLVIYIIVSIVFLSILRTGIDNYLKKQSQIKAQIMATAIDYQDLKYFDGNVNDLTKEQYYKLKNQLKKFKQEFSNIRFINLLGLKDTSSVFFFVDSEQIGSKDEAAPGEVYPNYPKEVLETFRINKANFSDQYQDQWGNWITAYYPVRDLNNKPLAILAIDWDAKEWNLHIRELLILPLVLLFIGAILLLINHYHKLNKVKLIDSEKQLEAVFSSDALYVVKIDLSGNYSYVNESFQKRFGWLNHGNSLVGINSLSTIVKEDHHKIIELTKKCIENPGITFQINLKKPDEISKFRMNMWELTYIKNDESNTNEILGIGKDITNLEQLERELVFERDLFSSGPVVTLIWENDDFWTIRYASKNINAVLGYSTEEFVNSKFADYLHPEDVDKINKEVSYYIINRVNSFEQSYRIRKKDGSYIWIFDLTKIYRNEKGIITEIRGYIFDQTKNKEYEEELKNQNILLEGILVGTNAGIWEWNIETGVLNINDRWAELIGYTKEELEPLTIDTWAKSLFPEDLKIAQKELELHFIGKLNYYDVVFRQYHKNGNVIWINSRGRVISRTEDGKPLRMQGTHIDLTDHIKTLHKSKENENLLRSFISNINGIAFLVDKDGVFRLSEGLGLNGLNLKPRDVVGKSIYEVYNGENELISQIEEALLGKSGVKVIKLNNKYFETNFSPIRDEEGLISGAIGISIDVTEKYKAEENLKKLNIAIEQSPVSIFITDPSGKIEYANSEFSRTSGYTKREYLGKNPRIFNSGLNDKKIYDKLWKTISSGKIWKGELLNKTKNDELIWESEIIAPILDNDNNIKNYICIRENITEKKKLLDELIKAKTQIEESDKLKTAFLQNMSHEIRTPLNGIIGFSRLLESEDLTKEEIGEFVGLIKSSSNRLLETINNILELSKIETQQIEINNDFVLVNELIMSVSETFANKIKQKGIELILHMPIELEKSILYSDRNKINIILKNLINNAIKFTNCGKIEIGYIFENDAYTFFVKDSGIGIKEEFLNKIFDRFFQADISISRNYEGTGLGLSVCKEYVNLLGGKIWVLSSYDKGSEFYFTVKNNVK